MSRHGAIEPAEGFGSAIQSRSVLYRGWVESSRQAHVTMPFLVGTIAPMARNPPLRKEQRVHCAQRYQPNGEVHCRRWP